MAQAKQAQVLNKYIYILNISNKVNNATFGGETNFSHINRIRVIWGKKATIVMFGYLVLCLRELLHCFYTVLFVKLHPFLEIHYLISFYTGRASVFSESSLLSQTRLNEQELLLKSNLVTVSVVSGKLRFYMFYIFTHFLVASIFVPRFL